MWLKGLKDAFPFRQIFCFKIINIYLDFIWNNTLIKTLIYLGFFKFKFYFYCSREAESGQSLQMCQHFYKFPNLFESVLVIN